jgi:hypothetical protein
MPECIKEKQIRKCKFDIPAILIFFLDKFALKTTLCGK